MRVCPGGTLCYTGEIIEVNMDAFLWVGGQYMGDNK